MEIVFGRRDRQGLWSS